MDELSIDPSRDWDRHCELEDRMYKELTANATCEMCAHCHEPEKEFENAERIGYCDEFDYFVKLDQRVADIDCEYFE